MSHTKYFERGQRVGSRVFFRDENGVLADPDIVRFKYRDPAEVLVVRVFDTDVDVVKEAVGTYVCRFTVNVSGAWACRWEGVGAIETAAEVEFVVPPSRVL